MLIRPATPADVPAVLPMVAKICAMHEALDPAKYGFLPRPEQRYHKWLTKLATDERSLFLVAEDNAIAPIKLVGFIVGTVEREIPIYRLKEYAFIHDLWVEPEYRRTGIARQLVIQAVEAFNAIGVEQIRLDTVAANDAARKLFAECGFRPSAIEMLIELS